MHRGLILAHNLKMPFDFEKYAEPSGEKRSSADNVLAKTDFGTGTLETPGAQVGCMLYFSAEVKKVHGLKVFGSNYIPFVTCKYYFALFADQVSGKQD